VPARFEIVSVRHQISDPYDISGARTGTGESIVDVRQRLAALFDDILADLHGRVVIARRTGHEYPAPINNGPRVSNLALKVTSLIDSLPTHAPQSRVQSPPGPLISNQGLSQHKPGTTISPRFVSAQTLAPALFCRGTCVTRMGSDPIRVI
jgi:hypothetical protein